MSPLGECFCLPHLLFFWCDGFRNLSGIFSTYFKKGGMQFKPNVVDRETLIDAYDHPEKYPHLLVRVAGYCSYFNMCRLLIVISSLSLSSSSLDLRMKPSIKVSLRFPHVIYISRKAAPGRYLRRPDKEKGHCRCTYWINLKRCLLM